ncbi:MAG TPA: GYF domain-containing protein, partial [Kofleriaceae bacterium]|nr:GYF domain-containing protein [Kofleriaceae bacterium]
MRPEHGVKFLCDRCKTRYSIGDDRVRGKILKIRCKNCANVITVREGMNVDPDAAPIPLDQPRVKKSTTGAPEALNELEARKESTRERGRTGSPRTERAPAAAAKADDAGRAGAGKRASQDARRSEPVNALSAAFASAMAKPPPALEEEWYVSIDGDQSGPFSLGDAQRWIADRPFDAELFCWSEGFDDWLPVDKVSHFRGLRKRPPPPAVPPPLPRIAGVAPRGAATPVPAPIDEEPKPLFAATMASLERAAPPMSNPAIALPAATPARATPPRGNPIAPRTNGVRNAAAPAAPAALDVRPSDAKPAAARPGGARAKSISDAFDSGDPVNRESPTQIEPVPFRDPILSPRGNEPPAPAGAGTGPAATVANPDAPASNFDDSGELAIG